MTTDERIDAIAVRLAELTSIVVQNEERHDRQNENFNAQIKQINATLNRAIRVGIREARQERAKRRELDEKLTQLAASQLLTEEALRRFLNRPSNGNSHSDPK